MRIKYYEETDSAVIWLRERGPDTVGRSQVRICQIRCWTVWCCTAMMRASLKESRYTASRGGAGKRLDLDKIELKRVPAGTTEGSGLATAALDRAR